MFFGNSEGQNLFCRFYDFKPNLALTKIWHFVFLKVFFEDLKPFSNSSFCSWPTSIFCKFLLRKWKLCAETLFGVLLGRIRVYPSSKMQNRTQIFGDNSCFLLFDHFLKIYRCFAVFEKNLRRSHNFEMFLFFCQFKLEKRKLSAWGVFDVIVDNIWCSVGSMISNRTWLWRTFVIFFSLRFSLRICSLFLIVLSVIDQLQFFVHFCCASGNYVPKHCLWYF